MKRIPRATTWMMMGLALVSMLGLRCSNPPVVLPEDSEQKLEGEFTEAETPHTGQETDTHPTEGEDSSVLEGEPAELIEGETPEAAEGERPTCTADCGYVIVHVYPHDPGAFTQGLAIDEGNLYEGTGLVGQSSLRLVNLESGAVLRQHNLPDSEFGEGITVFGNRIYQLTWTSKRGYVYDKETFEVLREFSYETEGWGLTHDGERLIMSDGTARLYFLDPESLCVLGELPVWDSSGPVTELNELEWVNGEILANVWKTNYVVRIDPESGQVRGRIYLQGLLSQEDSQFRPDVLNGIAYDALHDRLFVTGKRWPKLFEIELTPLK